LEEIGGSAVPQGSTMGNVLFLILVNDISSASPDLEFITYADDTCILVSADSLEILNSKVEIAMHQISQWFAANGMLLNVEKTNILHFQLRQNTENKLDIRLNNIEVPQVKEVRYLGFILDSGLTWSPHIDRMCDKLSSACFALSRIAPTLSYDNVKKAYYGYFHSILILGADMWATAADRDRPFKLQKRAIRIISGKSYDHPAKSLFKELKILTLPSVYILIACKYVRANVDQYATHSSARRNNCLIIPRCRLAKTRKSLGVLGAKLYNLLPEEIKLSKTDKMFDNKLKTMLTDIACYSVNEFIETCTGP
jgi:hypothetical protein